MALSHKINWTNTLFLILCPIVAIVGTVLLCVFGIVKWPTWILAGGYLVLSGLSVTAGYHRLFAHCSYQVSWPVRLVFLLLGAASFEGSALEWCTDHRNHHRYTDTDKDPYNIQRGFWYAHIGWLFTLDSQRRDFSNVEDLQKDPLVRFQDRFYVWLAVIFGFVLPAGIAALWADPIGGLIIVGALRISLNHHFTFFINSVCHLWGKRSYSTQQSARDHWAMALVTYGEGFHNFHHQFPKDYRNGIRLFHFDPSKWLICGLSWLRLARNLHRVSMHRIVRYRVNQDQQTLAGQMRSNLALWQASIEKIMHPMRDNINVVLKRIEHLESEYQKLRHQSRASKRDRLASNRYQVKMQRQYLKAAYQELRLYLDMWQNLCRQCRRGQLIAQFD